MSHFFLFWISSTRDSDSRFFLENWMTFSAERCKIRLIVKSRGDKKSCNSPLSYFVYMARLKNQTRTLDFLTIVNKERTCFHLYIDASPISHFQTTLRNSLLILDQVKCFFTTNVKKLSWLKDGLWGRVESFFWEQGQFKQVLPQLTSVWQTWGLSKLQGQTYHVCSRPYFP